MSSSLDYLSASGDWSDTTTGIGNELGTIAGAIRTASTSTEARFVDIAGRLETSIEMVTALTNTFDTLSNELKGENLRQATDDLSQVALRVSALAQSQGSKISEFNRLASLTAAIQNRIAQMGESVGGVAVLATNAKIAAAYIDHPDGDFMSFAREIDRTLRVAKVSLNQFAAELAGVGRLLHTAITSQSASEEHQKAAIQAIPVRVRRNIDAIAERRKRAAETAVAVARGSQRIGRRIGDAVAALQIGDVTRQRIEHVDYAIGLLAGIVAPPSVVHHAERDQWTALTEAQRESLTVFCCQLQSTQLIDMADKFDHEVQQILQSLHDLSSDASEILQLGTEAFGAAGKRGGTFLGDLEEEVGAVDRLLTSFREALCEADQVATSVSEATTRLAVHISTVRSLEADIHIMGLNMTLKCGRFGSAGRPLSIIAQELRSYATKIATEVNDVSSDLNQIIAIACDLSGHSGNGDGTDIASIAEIMASSLSRLGVAEQNLDNAWRTLEQDGDVLAGLLRETVSRTHVHEEIGRVLRRAAADLTAVAPNLGDNFEKASQVDHLCELMMNSYTMEAERNVLAAQAPGWSRKNNVRAGQAHDTGTAVAQLDDIFF
ncbi:MAG: chemotaxis protein [Acetobacteraceae bacterium]|nr:chemotaxis protein [Acetobacteraceae bacterium]